MDSPSEKPYLRLMVVMVVVVRGRVSYVDNLKLHVHSSLLHVVTSNIRNAESAHKGILLIILRCLGTDILLRMGINTLNHKIADYYIQIYTAATVTRLMWSGLHVKVN